MESAKDIESHFLKQNDLFAIYSMPGQIDHFVLIEDDNLKSNYDGNGVFIIAPFDNASADPFVTIRPTRVIKNERGRACLHRQVKSNS